MKSTSGVDVLLIAFQALTDEEQDRALQSLAGARAAALAGDESDIELIVRSLRLVAGRVDGEITADAYRTTAAVLREEGHEVVSLARVIRHYGTWRLAREALELSDTQTAKRIEARFRSRRLGKVWRYTDDFLGECVRRATDHWGRCPTVAEFEWWRDREIELLRARGEHLHLPTASPYRRRWGTWEAALLHFGFTPDQVAERLERHEAHEAGAPRRPGA